MSLREAREKLAKWGVLDALDSQVAGLGRQESAAPRTDKLLKDPLWGMIRIPRYLVPVVDSPIVQRLRRVRQLGLSFLVYPTATHTRFEHSLGALHLVQLVLKNAEMNQQGVDDPTRRQLELAALLHDAGHMPFSHASERWLQEIRDDLTFGATSAFDVIKLIADALNLSEPKLAEVLSVLVLLSPRFRLQCRDVPPAGVDHDEFFDRAAALAVGAVVDPAKEGLSEILSGTLDVDRLDYMPRDARSCGIMVSMDVPRLLTKCNLVQVQRKSLPSTRKKKGQPSALLLFATDLTGANGLEELAASRFVLYDRVYHHHKTQAAEAVLR